MWAMVTRPRPVWPRRSSRFGGLDILVNNAGTNPYFGPMVDIDLVRAQKTFEVNQLAVLMWSAYAVKAGLRGSIINVASIGGLGVEPGIGWYNVTKAAVLHITRQLAFELAPDIRVNALAPGLIKTKLAARPVGGAGRGADRCPHTPPPFGAARRRRHGRLVSGLRCRLMDHRADPRRRRGHDHHSFRRGWLRTRPPFGYRALLTSPIRHHWGQGYDGEWPSGIRHYRTVSAVVTPVECGRHPVDPMRLRSRNGTGAAGDAPSPARLR